MKKYTEEDLVEGSGFYTPDKSKYIITYPDIKYNGYNDCVLKYKDGKTQYTIYTILISLNNSIWKFIPAPTPILKKLLNKSW